MRARLLYLSQKRIGYFVITLKADKNGLISISPAVGFLSAKKIAKLLLTKKLAACVSLKNIYSIYKWEGKIEKVNEVEITIKSSPNLKNDFLVFLKKEIQSQNLLNKVGALGSNFFIYQLFGIAAFILPYLLGYTGYLLFFDRKKNQLLNHWSWALLYLICISIFFGFYHMDSPLLGGLVGYEINSFLLLI